MGKTWEIDGVYICLQDMACLLFCSNAAYRKTCHWHSRRWQSFPKTLRAAGAAALSVHMEGQVMMMEHVFKAFWMSFIISDYTNLMTLIGTSNLRKKSDPAEHTMNSVPRYFTWNASSFITTKEERVQFMQNTIDFHVRAGNLQSNIDTWIRQITIRTP